MWSLLVVLVVAGTALGAPTTVKELDWYKRSIQVTRGEPQCTGKVTVEYTIPLVDNHFVLMGEDRAHIFECTVEGKILSERGNELASYVDRNAVYCSTECKVERVNEEFKWAEVGDEGSLLIPVNLEIDCDLITTKEHLDKVVKELADTSKKIKEDFQGSYKPYLESLHNSEKQLLQLTANKS